MAREMRQGGVVMPSDDGRTNRTHDRRRQGIVIDGTAPRVAPPKAWDSSKPPGGKLPKPAPKAERKS